ncbi:MAG: hypothetical protein QXQ62_03530 [Candidatus Bathyarchaeia archaeon]
MEALEMYANRNKQLFVSIVRQGLNEILGDAAAETLIHYIGGNEILQDPNVMVHRLRAVLGVGADIIFRHIVREMKKVENSVG